MHKRYTCFGIYVELYTTKRIFKHKNRLTKKNTNSLFSDLTSMMRNNLCLHLAFKSQLTSVYFLDLFVHFQIDFHRIFAQSLNNIHNFPIYMYIIYVYLYTRTYGIHFTISYFGVKKMSCMLIFTFSMVWCF